MNPLGMSAFFGAMQNQANNMMTTHANTYKQHYNSALVQDAQMQEELITYNALKAQDAAVNESVMIQMNQREAEAESNVSSAHKGVEGNGASREIDKIRRNAVHADAQVQEELQNDLLNYSVQNQSVWNNAKSGLQHPTEISRLGNILNIGGNVWLTALSTGYLK